MWIGDKRKLGRKTQAFRRHTVAKVCDLCYYDECYLRSLIPENNCPSLMCLSNLSVSWLTVHILLLMSIQHYLFYSPVAFYRLVLLYCTINIASQIRPSALQSFPLCILLNFFLPNFLHYGEFCVVILFLSLSKDFCKYFNYLLSVSCLPDCYCLLSISANLNHALLS